MKKFTLFFLAAVSIIVLGTVSSCKDYEDDLYNNFNMELINKETSLKDLLKTQDAALQKQIDALNAELAILKNCSCTENFEKITKKIAEIDSILKVLKQNDIDLATEDGKIRQEIKDQVAALKIALRDLKDELNANIAQTKSDLTTLINANKVATDTRLDEVEKDLLAKWNLYLQTVQRIDNEIDKINTAITDLQNNKLDKSEFELRIQAIINDYQKYTDNAIAALKGELQADYNALLTALETKLTTEIQGVANRVADLETAKITIENNITTLQNTVAKIQEVLAKDEQKIDSLGRDIIKINGNIDLVWAAINSLEKRVDSLKLADIYRQLGELSVLQAAFPEVQKQAFDALKLAETNALWIEHWQNKWGEDLEGLADNALFKAMAAMADTANTLRAEAQAMYEQSVKLASAYADTACAKLQITLESKIADAEAGYQKADSLLQDSIDKLAVKVDSLITRVDKIDQRLSAVEGKLDKLVTSIEVNGAINEIVGYAAAPLDVRTNILAAWYGKSTKALRFPANDVKAEGCEGQITIMNNQDLVSQDGAEGNAGKVWLTLNPFDKNFTGVVPTLSNSQGEASAVKLSALEYSYDVLTFGYSRAGSANGFYEAKATISADQAWGVRPNVNKEAIVDVAKKTLSAPRNIELTNVFSTMYKAMQNVLPALAVKVEASDKSSAIISQYSIAATSMPALSYDFLKDLSLPRKPHINLGLPSSIEMNINYSDATVHVNPDGTNYVVVKYDYPTDVDPATGKVIKTEKREVKIDLSNFVSSINGQIEGNVDKLINEIKTQVNDQFKDLLKNGNKIINRVNRLLDRAYNFVENINSKLQPILVFDVEGNGETNYHLCSEVVYGPSVFSLHGLSEGAIVLHPTSFSGELLAPAYKKYIAVTNVYADNTGTTVAPDAASIKDYCNNHELNMNKVIDGYIHSVALPVKSSMKGKVLEITYSAVDYSGVAVTNKYYVTIQ